MLVYDIEDVDIDEFKKVFKKKLSSFCEKSPIIISYFMIGDTVTVRDKTWPEDEWEKNYSLKYHLPEKANVKMIRDDLEERYPTIEMVYDEPISDRVATEKLKEGYALEEIMVMTERVTIEKYKIMKILQESNELVVMDFEDEKMKILGVKIPVIKVMDMVYNKDPNLQEVFASKVYFKQTLKVKNS